MDKKQAILKATMQLVAQHGFHATPMSMVAKEANVAAGTIYHYFKSKDELINELYLQLKHQMGLAALNKDDQSKNYKERFFTFWISLFEFFLEHPQEFMFLEQYTNSPFIHQAIKEKNRPLAYFIHQGIQSGVLREMNADLMAALVYGSVVSTVKLALSKQISISKSMLQSAAQSCWDGVKIT